MCSVTISNPMHQLATWEGVGVLTGVRTCSVAIANPMCQLAMWEGVGVLTGVHTYMCFQHVFTHFSFFSRWTLICCSRSLSCPCLMSRSLSLLTLSCSSCSFRIKFLYSSFLAIDAAIEFLNLYHVPASLRYCRCAFSLAKAPEIKVSVFHLLPLSVCTHWKHTCTQTHTPTQSNSPLLNAYNSLSTGDSTLAADGFLGMGGSNLCLTGVHRAEAVAGACGGRGGGAGDDDCEGHCCPRAIMMTPSPPPAILTCTCTCSSQEYICVNIQLGRVWWSCKDHVHTCVFNLGGCWGSDRSKNVSLR